MSFEKAVHATLNEIDKLCILAGYNLVNYLESTKIDLKNELKELLTPNTVWFNEGKSLKILWT